jgi:shikimate kinase
MRTKEKEKMVKTIEKLTLELQLEKAKTKAKNAEIKKLAREKNSITEKLESSLKKNVTLQDELKKNSGLYSSSASHRTSQIQ